MSNEKDKISRKAFSNPDAREISRLFSLDIKTVTPMPPRVRQTIEERETDVLLLVETTDNRKIVIHIEFQSSNDKKMAIRMAIYDFMLYYQEGLEVYSTVIYIGKDPLSMKKNINFFGAQYTCPIIDIRDLDPQLFMESKSPGLVIYALLAGRANENRQHIIWKILTKLQSLLHGSKEMLTEYIIEMEFLSQTRSKHVQQLIKKEVAKMPITLKWENSLYYQEAFKKGKLEDAERMINIGLTIEQIHQYTGLDIRTLNKLYKRLKAA